MQGLFLAQIAMVDSKFLPSIFLSCTPGKDNQHMRYLHMFVLAESRRKETKGRESSNSNDFSIILGPTIGGKARMRHPPPCG
jgi:hypothetical protein